jgi:hypothetical protein
MRRPGHLPGAGMLPGRAAPVALVSTLTVHQQRADLSHAYKISADLLEVPFTT